MKKLSLLAILLLLTPLAAFAQTQCTNNVLNPTFTASLLGSNVVGSTGLNTGFANATIVFNNGQATITSNTMGLNNITGITLYQGAPGTNGTPVQTFTTSTSTFTGGQLSRTLTVDPTLLSAIQSNPQNYYLVITTSDFPNGAVRGPLVSANAQQFGGVLTAVNSGPAGGSGVFAFSLSPNPGGQTYTLHYDITTNGIGNTATGFTLTPVGGNPVTFAGGDTEVNGRFTGTTTIDMVTAQQLLCNPSGYNLGVSTTAFANGALTGSVSTTKELFIPVVGSVPGQNGTIWKTDLNLYNNNQSSPATVYLQYFPEGPSSSTAQLAATASLNAGAIRLNPDIATAIFNDALSGIGALRILSSGSIFANARIYNDQSASGKGTFGQNVPGLPRSAAVSEGILVGTINTVSGGVTGSTNARTNVGLFNPSDNPTSVALQLRSTSGAVAATNIVTLQPWQHMQMPLSGTTGAAFPFVTGDVGASAVSFLAGSPIFAYASVVDNVSGDGSFILPSVDQNNSTPVQ
ncbi:MAG TPA: CHRD domain-containing protein [Thermoanaerobaculia bacterium]